MDKNNNYSRIIWVPRVIIIAYILFLMLFSLDVFSMEGSFMEKTSGFIIHSIPSLIMAALLGVFWKRSFILGWVFIGVAAVFTFWFGTYVRVESFLLISTPPLISGIFFLIAGRRGQEKALLSK